MPDPLTVNAVKLAADSVGKAIDQLGLAHTELEAGGFPDRAHKNAVDMQIAALTRRKNILDKIVRDLTE